MSHHHHHHHHGGRPDDDSRVWQDEEGLHIDVRGLNPPEPAVAILQLLEGDGIAAVIAHLDREPVFLYPELDERGFGYEMMDSHCGGDDACEHGVQLKIIRLRP